MGHEKGLFSIELAETRLSWYILRTLKIKHQAWHTLWCMSDWVLQTFPHMKTCLNCKHSISSAARLTRLNVNLNNSLVKFRKLGWYKRRISKYVYAISSIQTWRLTGAFPETYILELPLTIVTIIKIGPYISSVMFIYSTNEFLEQDDNNWIGSLYMFDTKYVMYIG